MVKAHTPINWENEPSYNTPLNAANLNKMDSEIGILDDRIIEQDTIKLDKATANTMVKAISFDENTGVFTITLLNGSTTKIDTKLEKVVVNFSYDATTQQIIINLVDGTKQYIDLSALITQYEFVDSQTIAWEVTAGGKVKAKILDGSITENMLQPNYLAEIKVESAKSAQSMANAKISENNAKQSELNAKASEEQALEYSNNAQPVAQSISGNNPTATNSTDGKVIYLKNSGYTKQDGTPTPDTPIHIDGLGDKGYFDGELVQGYIGSSGTIITDSHAVTSKNIIPCSEEDTIVINYEETVTNLAIVTYNNGTYVGTIDGANVSSNSYTIPSGVDGFKFFIYDGNGITPSTAKHISVTINGQYAIRVKTGNKNVLDIKEENSLITNTDGTIISQNDCAYAIVDVINWDRVTLQGDFTLLGNSVLRVGYCTEYPNVGVKATRGNWYGNDVYNVSAYNYLLLTFVTNGTSTTTDFINSFFLEYGTVATPYVPHQSSEALIPVSAPLYDGDYIEVYADGSGQIVRTMGSIVYDGSESEWMMVTNPNKFYLYNNGITHKREYGLTNYLCGHFVAKPQNSSGTEYTDDNTMSLDHTSNIIRFICEKFSTVDEWKTWLQSNPIHVVYELATPTTEPLTAEQVAEFMKLQTFNEVTHINADGEVTVRYYCNNDSGDTVGMLHEMVEDTQNQIDTKLNGIFKIVEVGTVLGGMQPGAIHKDLYIDINRFIEDGYLPISISGYNVDKSDVNLYRLELNTTEGKIYFSLYNTSSEFALANVSLDTKVLLVKEDFFAN